MKMMDYQTITVEKKSNGIVHVRLNRPQLHNAFNDEMIGELTQAFNELGGDRHTQVIILSGEGKSFCAGADLNWMKRMKDYTMEENVRDSRALSKMLQAINFCPVPVIAKVHGAALGGGVGLLSCCDFVIAEEGTTFGLTEVRLGLLPAVISPFVISKIGPSHARALFISGERFKTDRALQIGLIHSVSLERHFTADVEKLALSLLETGPQARRLAKSLAMDVTKLLDSEFKAIEDLTCELIASVRIGPEGQEGMSALLEKRKPQWPE
jgi:methylglutaconyl-CoA hydratase